MKISEAVKRLNEILSSEGDIELIYNDMDTDWSFKINEENITIYKGVCEIYLQNKYCSETHCYDVEEYVKRKQPFTLEIGKSYWLVGEGKVWIDELKHLDGKIVAARCHDVNKREIGWQCIEDFEEIE